MRKKVVIFLMLALVFYSSAGLSQDFLDKKIVVLGKPVPNFKLSDALGKEHELSEFQGKIVMIHFWSTECPFVNRYEPRIQQLANDYLGTDVVVLGIDSNVNESPEAIQKVAEERGVNYPIWVDSTSKVADDFGAITTPHVFILDKTGALVYEGSVDDQGWSDKNPVTKNYARDVIDALVSGAPVPHSRTKTFGCTVKRA
jgi:thiol-disulfide isomerase/thioredoxin